MNGTAKNVRTAMPAAKAEHIPALKLLLRLEHAAWKGSRTELFRTIRAALAAVPLPEGIDGAQVSVLLAENSAIAALNHDFRGRDKPTNVLSFPAEEEGYLGDIMIAPDVVRQEAEQQGKDFAHHLAHLAVHGLLHLLGYDHGTDAQAHEMERLEIEILGRIAIANPYL